MASARERFIYQLLLQPLETSPAVDYNGVSSKDVLHADCGKSQYLRRTHEVLGSSRFRQMQWKTRVLRDLLRQPCPRTHDQHSVCARAPAP